MNRLLKFNPELAKYVWLEFSLARLLAMPAVIGLVALLVVNSNDTLTEGIEMLRWVSVGGFAAIGMFWGMRSASASIIDEHNEKTWDWQRLSGVAPWRLTIGKLLGSTLYNWYGALICLAIMFATSMGEYGLLNSLLMIINLVLTTLALHGFISILALLAIRRTDARQKVKSAQVMVGGIVFIWFMGQAVAGFFASGSMFDGLQGGQSKWMVWYGMRMSVMAYSLISILFLCGWVLAGLYRSMRAELRFSDLPTWWITYLISQFLFGMGYKLDLGETSVGGPAFALVTNFFMTGTLVYLLALFEPKDILTTRWLMRSVREGRYMDFLRSAPLWAITIPVCALFGLLAVFALFISPIGSAINELFGEIKVMGGLWDNVLAAYLAIMGFIIRDMAVIQYMGLARFPKRSNLGIIVYLVLIYTVIPGLVFSVPGLISFFLPNPMAGSLIMVLAPWSLTIVAVVLLVRKWKDLEGVKER